MKYKARSSLLAGAGLVITLAAVGCGGTAKSASSTASASPSQNVALSVCHSAVKQRVNAQQGTFQFVGEVAKATNYGFIITGNVTAKNDAGTAVQNHYVCSAEQNGSSWIAQGVTLSS